MIVLIVLLERLVLAVVILVNFVLLEKCLLLVLRVVLHATKGLFQSMAYVLSAMLAATLHSHHYFVFHVTEKVPIRLLVHRSVKLLLLVRFPIRVNRML
jgi:hypothetical protein